ncbi:MAG: hypothetical protein MUC74_05680 [Ideonella sp.]|jgi:hypothetical protein|nr:hypothetical protein [Ideonella sp.]
MTRPVDAGPGELDHGDGVRAAAAPRAGWRPLAVVLVAGALALAARHALVEPAALTARCDAAPWDGIACSLRSAVVQGFIEHRLALLAAVTATLAWVWRSSSVALAALALGVAGMVLYSASLAAPAALVALLVCVHAGSRRGDTAGPP